MMRNWSAGAWAIRSALDADTGQSVVIVAGSPARMPLSVVGWRF
jgi:hypothetical protein